LSIGTGDCTAGEGEAIADLDGEATAGEGDAIADLDGEVIPAVGLLTCPPLCVL